MMAVSCLSARMPAPGVKTFGALQRLVGSLMYITLNGGFAYNEDTICTDGGEIFFVSNSVNFQVMSRSLTRHNERALKKS